MSVDFYAVGTALAATMGGATCTSPPLGGTAIRQATVLAPNGMEVWPALVVELPHSGQDATVDSGDQRLVNDFDVFFIIGQASGDLPRMRETLLRWLGPLLNSTYGAMKLGQGAVVDKAYVVSYAEQPYNYAGIEYPAWHLVARVWTDQYVTLTP